AGARTRQCAGLIGLSGLHGEQLARLGDALGTIAVGEQTVVADAMEAFRQHVHEEAPDELADFERHRLPAARTVDSIVLPSERDAVVVGGDQTAIGDGHTMSVAREISQHLLWSRERVLAI